MRTAADSTYAQLQTNETEAADTIKFANGILLANQGKIKEGKVVTDDTGMTGDALTVIKVDASSITGTNKVELGFKATCTFSGKNSDVKIAKLADISDLSAATYTSVTALAASSEATVGNANDKGTVLSYDMSADIAADDDKVLYYVLYTYTGRQQKLSDFTLTITPLYAATVTVKDNAETPAAVEGATVTIKSGENVVATGATVADGTFSANLPAGTYSVTAAKTGYNAPADAAALTITNAAASVDITLTEQSDPTYNVTVNTAPFATVKLNAGTSTAGTAVAEQTVTANYKGVATLTGVPAGTTYTADVTTTNKYLDNKTAAPVTVVNAETPVDLKLAYKAEYANMVYGEDFSYAAGSAIIGVNETNGIVSNSNTPYSGMTVSVGGENKTGGNVSPIAANNNFGYYSAGFNKGYTLTYNPAKKITKIAFDAALGAQTWAGRDAGSARGNDVVTLTIGNLVITATPSSTAETVTITDGATDNTKTAASALTPLGWARYEIEVGAANAVTVKITPAGGATETITGLTLSADATTAVFTGSKTASFAVDNFEIYSAE